MHPAPCFVAFPDDEPVFYFAWKRSGAFLLLTNQYSSCAGSTRASIFFAKKMDCRIKSGNDDRKDASVKT
jgi:hypothetical protein